MAKLVPRRMLMGKVLFYMKSSLGHPVSLPIIQQSLAFLRPYAVDVFQDFQNLLSSGNITSQGYQPPSHLECYLTSTFYSLSRLLYDVHFQMVGFPGCRFAITRRARTKQIQGKPGTALPCDAMMALLRSPMVVTEMHGTGIPDELIDLNLDPQIPVP